MYILFTKLHTGVVLQSPSNGSGRRFPHKKSPAPSRMPPTLSICTALARNPKDVRDIQKTSERRAKRRAQLSHGFQKTLNSVRRFETLHNPLLRINVFWKPCESCAHLLARLLDVFWTSFMSFGFRARGAYILQALCGSRALFYVGACQGVASRRFKFERFPWFQV